MIHLKGLTTSLLLLSLIALAVGRMVGAKELEGFALRASATFFLILLALPLVAHEADAMRQGPSRTATCAMPEVVVVAPEHLVGGALVVAGHLAVGLWWLRRRARGEGQRRAAQEREADRRRERGRLAPRDLDGGAS